MIENLVIGIFGIIATCFAIYIGYKRRKKPDIYINANPSGGIWYCNPIITFRNEGDFLKNVQLIGIPNDFICGLPLEYKDVWIPEEEKSYSLAKKYFPIRQKVCIYIIVEDNHNYKYCVYVKYKNNEFVITKISSYNMLTKFVLNVKRKKNCLKKNEKK